ncbi:AgmX/PglI C-terminal domain-containing protein [Marinobacter caseinilyticus]|uniref:AgmX/PglI C-terminal domain-containing protein n=1 Tax=Marinobacter caseinilyticus TaxID=2692195 RepID=UPI00140CF822|nr:AgmX/PglI C-terminal domain-containing protein [Marinobacter caseinilyticus]
MTALTITHYEFALPWEASDEEDSRFKRILKRLLLLLLLLAVIFPWLPLPEIEREEKERLPPSLAKVLIEQRKVVPPPPPPEPVRQEEKAEPEPTEKKAAPKPAPAKEVKKAREKVSKMGVAAFSKELSSLRSSLNVAKLQARNTNVTTGAAAKAARSVLGATSATKTSGGVNSSVMNDSGSGTQLAAHSSTAVESPIGSGTGGGGGSSSGGGSHRSSVDGGRDMESIRRVFEQHKGAIYALYNRALRSDPGLQGKFVFHIVIEPDGSISSIKLVDSQLEDKKLALKLLARIQMISFGPEDVQATPVNYKFDFMPG